MRHRRQGQEDIRYRLPTHSINKSNSIRSIFIRELLGLPATRASLNLNSRRNTKDNAIREFKPKEINFTYKIPDSTDTIQIPITILEDLNEQDVYTWIEKIREAATLLEWNDLNVRKILKVIMTSDIYDLIKNKTSAEGVFDELLSITFPPSQYKIYLEQLTRVKQENYYTIKEYKNKIEDLVTKASLCAKIKRERIKEKVNETFLLNLHPKTEIEMIKHGKYSAEEIFSLIDEIETTIIARTTTHMSETHSSAEYTPKYCTYHKNPNHDTSECLVLKRKEKDKKTSKNYAINEIIQQVREPRIDIIIKDKPYQVILDTGSKHSFINKRIVTELGLKISDTEGICVEFGNGQKAITTQTTEIEFSFPSIRNLSLRCKLYILNGKSSAIILGTEFMQENEVIINFKNNFIRLNGLEFELDEKCKSKPPEATLFSKTELLNIKTLKREDFINEYMSLNKTLGRIPCEPHVINVKEKTPFFLKEYPIPIKYKISVEHHIDDLLNRNIIKPSKSPYNSPAFPLIKKNGEIRLVVDYRKLNSITENEHYPFPTIREQIIDLEGNSVFSQLDLANGYYQIPLSKESMEYTAFSVLGRKYEYTVMPFGLKNAPFTFQRTMKNITSNIPNIKVFLDDILVYSDSMENHKSHLYELLQRLYENNVKINFKKSNLFKNEVGYLGHIISEKGVKPDLTVIKKLEIKPPKTKKELMKILGILQWYRPFIRNISKILQPLFTKLKKSETFEWSDRDTKVLTELKDKILKQTLLIYPNPNHKFYLSTDASETAIGAVLTQEKGVIGYFSRCLNSVEVRYTITEKEMLAIVRALEYFRDIVLGCKIEIKTDNKNVATARNGFLSKRIERWKMAIVEYDVEIKHASARENLVADNLSRVFMIKDRQICSLEGKEIGERLLRIYAEILGKQEAELITEITIEDLQILHIKLGHPSASTMYVTLRNVFQDLELRRKVRTVCFDCYDCQTIKCTHHNFGQVKGYLISESPNLHISSDIVGPYRLNKISKIYILTVTDICTRFTRVKIMDQITSDEVAENFKTCWIDNYGPPKRLTTDLGKQYTGSSFRNLIKRYGIIHSYTSVMNPTGNAVSERINGQINEIMRIESYVSKTEIEMTIENRLNLLVHSATGTCPHLLFHEKDPKELEEAVEKLKKQGDTRNIKINKKRILYSYQVGEYCFHKTHGFTKQERRFAGPYKILEKDEYGNRVKIANGRTRFWANIKNIKPIKQMGGEYGGHEPHEVNGYTSIKRLISGIEPEFTVGPRTLGIKRK